MTAPSAKFPDPAFQELLADIGREWDKAEHVMKRAEQVSAEANISAINELRYAGRRIVDALNASATGVDSAKTVALLEDARFDCHRARHDAMDAALDVMAKDFDNLTKRLGVENVVSAYPGFSDLFIDFMNARKKIAASRADRANRDLIYDSITAVDFIGTDERPGLADRYAGLITAKPIALKFRAKQQRQRIGWWIMLAITLVSLTIAAISLRLNMARTVIDATPASATGPSVGR